MPNVACARAGCGVRNSPTADACQRCHDPLREPELGAIACPACAVARRGAGPLERFAAGPIALHGCATCRGVFVTARAWCLLLAAPERSTEVTQMLGALGASGAVLDLVKCPVCAKPLERGRFAGRSAVVVDLCDRHGLWLDAGELTQILAFTAETRQRPPALEAGPMLMAAPPAAPAASAPPSRGAGGVLVLLGAVLLAGSALAGYAMLRGKLGARGEDVKRAAEQTGQAVGHGR
jgi:Zn-finger nucleic acid-binding protein